MEFVKPDSPHFADEIRSLAHDAVIPGHDRDYRSLVVFFGNVVTRKIAVRVFDLRHREEGGYTLTANWFAHPLVMGQ